MSELHLRDSGTSSLYPVLVERREDRAVAANYSIRASQHLGGVLLGLTRRLRDAGGMLLWVYPHGPLSDVIEYAVEVEAEHGGVRVMVARDERSVPHAIAVSVGDNAADFGDALTMWGLASLDDSNEPPPEWFG